MAEQKNHAELTRKSISAWVKKVNVSIDALARQSCQALADEVVMTTPVDTGMLRGSWQPSLDTPNLSGVGSPDPSGNVALARVGVVISELKAGHIFHMINNAAYARRLEYGFVGEDKLGRHYNQRGRFFVQRALKRWPTIVRKTANMLAASKAKLTSAEEIHPPENT